MDNEIKEYLDSLSKICNGQIRGTLNEKAKEYNLEIITMTLYSVFQNGFLLGKKAHESDEVLDRLKEELGLKEKK